MHFVCVIRYCFLLFVFVWCNSKYNQTKLLHHCVILPLRCPLKVIYGLYCTLGSTEQASSSSSTSLLRELCVPLVKDDTLGSILLLDPLVSDLHLLPSTISILGLGPRPGMMWKREKAKRGSTTQCMSLTLNLSLSFPSPLQAPFLFSSKTMM